MSAPLVAAMVAAGVLTAIGVVQALAAAGRPWGRFVWGGRHEVLPRRLRVGSALSIPLYAGMVAVLLLRAGAHGDPGPVLVVATWVLTAYFGVGILLNAASRSRAERLAMVPACVVLTACCLLVATG